MAEETERALSAAGITVLPIGSSADYRLITTLTLGDRLAVRNRLVDSRDSSRVIDLVYDIPSESLGSLTDRIASVVLTGLGRPQRPFAIPTQTPAYLTYLRALSYRRSANPADVRWAAELFRQVIAADSGFSPAWHGLAGALQAIAVAEGRRSPGLETEWREAVRRSAGLDSVAAVGRRPVVAGAEGREPH